jgi:hypothetical protein
MSLDEAVAHTRSGDIWIFRGRRAPDRLIRAVTNAPVNHVGMSVVIDDLPPLLWHAELGKKQRDVWSGGHHRGVQLHELHEAVARWRDEYGQKVWLRQLQPEVGQAEEDGMARDRPDGRCVVPVDGSAGRALAPRPQRRVRRPPQARDPGAA